MTRIIIRHLSGSKTNHVEEFPVNLFPEITIGRDPTAILRFDPDRDDLVGRQHAKITVDTMEPGMFVLHDLGSRNGVYVNRQRIVGTARIAAGDTVQLGPGGPEIQVDLEPRPQNTLRPTREATTGSGSAAGTSPVPATREAAVSGSGTVAYAGTSTASSGAVGKATVERLISQTRADTRRSMVTTGGIAAGVIVLLIIGVAAVSIYNSRQLQANIETVQAGGTGAPAWDEIAKKNSDAVVFLEVSWYLEDTSSHNLVYHVVKDGRPVFIQIPTQLGSPPIIEPLLDKTEQSVFDGAKKNIPIGGHLTGTGFLVDSQGYIFTSRQLTAGWTWPYQWDREKYSKEGILYVYKSDLTDYPRQENLEVKDFPTNWIPQRSLQFQIENLPLSIDKAKKNDVRQALLKTVEGRFSTLDVALAGTRDRNTASMVKVSDEHDVSIVHVNIPGATPSVQISDTDAELSAGSEVLVMGYPAISPVVIGRAEASNPVAGGAEMKEIPTPTSIPGSIGRRLPQGQSRISGQPIYNTLGDAYQLTLSHAGSGTRGSPVFDKAGKVIGILFEVTGSDGTIVPFAVPIQYGQKLLRSNKIVN